jgi:GAF domain-containing protein
VAVPLPGFNGASSGVLSVHSDQRDAFDARAIHLIAAVADVVRHALLSAELLERTTRAFEAMRAAWDQSVIVNQAVGVLIRWNCTEEEARSRLSRMARRGGDDLATSARMIVEEARKEDNRSVVASRHSPRNT